MTTWPRLGTGMGAVRSGPPLVLALLTSALLGGAAACGSPEAERGELRVFAASSLTEAFTALAAEFETNNPGTDVSLTFAGSQVLRIQVEQGAPADVFASANPDHMRALVDAGLVRASRVFARNDLAVIVPSANPAEIEVFADLARARRLVIGTDNVPVGAYAREALRRAEPVIGTGFADTVLSRVASEESNTRLVRAKVELGEADAAIVYRTDALASTAVQTIEVPPSANVAAEYTIGIAAGAADAPLAERWVALLSSDAGQGRLARFGFSPP